MMDQLQLEVIRTLIATYFKNKKGEPYEATDGQCEVFASVINPDIPWLWLSAPTRYGKSEVLAMALIYLAKFHNLKLPIVGGSQEKAEKIMDYVIQHIGDNEILYKGLINITALSDIEKLKISVSKETLKWAGGGWIFVTSIDSRNISKEGEKVVGEGGDIIILEEAGLIKHKEQYSKVVRMSERDNNWGKLVMSGNCVEKSIFEDAFNNPLFHKVRITLEQAVAEGRFDMAYLNEKKTMTTTKDWKRYYLVEFPVAGENTYFKPMKYEYLPTDLEYVGATDLALGKLKPDGTEGEGSLVALVNLGRSKQTGQVYEVESIGKRMKPSETIRTIFNYPYKYLRFGIEAVGFQAYFLEVITEKSKEEKRYIPFEAIQQKRKKEERIESLEPFINTGQILFRGDNQLWDDMQDYPTTELLDILDALEMAWRTLNKGDGEFAFV